MLKLILYDYSYAYILPLYLLHRTVSVANMAGGRNAANNKNKTAVFKNCAPFNYCISEVNNTRVDNTNDFDVVMPIHHFSIFKKLIRLCQYYGDELVLTDVTVTFNFKEK